MSISRTEVSLSVALVALFLVGAVSMSGNLPLNRSRSGAICL